MAIGLDVQLSALGSILETRIAGHRVELRLPRPPLSENGIGLNGGDLTAPPFEHVRDAERLRAWMGSGQSSSTWGQCYMREPGGGGAAWVQRCALVVPIAEDLPTDRRNSVADEIFGQVDLWRSVVLDWLHTAHRQLLGSYGTPKMGHAIQPWLWSHDGHRRVVHYNNPPLTINVSPDNSAVDASALQTVLYFAEHGTRPPLAWRLTRDAARQRLAGDHRRAVLDAGTAAELALVELLRQHARAVDEDRDTLGDLIEKAQGVDVLRVVDAKTDLLQVRNDAAHSAKVPNAQTTLRALQISAQYVDDAWPRRALLAAAMRGYA